MKPTEWNSMPKQEKEKFAKNLFNSARGNYIIGQALTLSIERMKKVKNPEISNIQDMEVLEECFFPIFKMQREAEKKFQNKIRVK